jgi:hypothetical protein
MSLGWPFHDISQTRDVRGEVPRVSPETDWLAGLNGFEWKKDSFGRVLRRAIGDPEQIDMWDNCNQHWRLVQATDPLWQRIEDRVPKSPSRD